MQIHNIRDIVKRQLVTCTGRSDPVNDRHYPGVKEPVYVKWLNHKIILFKITSHIVPKTLKQYGVVETRPVMIGGKSPNSIQEIHIRGP